MTNQRLFPNKEGIKKNLQELIHGLTDCEDYIEKVLKGELPSDPAIAKSLNQSLNKFSSQDMEVLEKIVKENYEDSIILSNLTKLQSAHIAIASKLEQLFGHPDSSISSTSRTESEAVSKI